METTLSELIESRNFDLIRKVQDEFKIVVDIFNEYKRINIEDLNRSTDGSSVDLSRNFIEDHYYKLQKFIYEPSSKEFFIEIQKSHDSLANLLFDELTDLVGDYRQRAIKIAKDLGKEEPRFEINIPKVSISSKQRTLLDKCMIHILRNALDHGIESKEERLAKHKDVRGILKIDGKVGHGKLEIYLSDDGRGLALGLLRKIGLSKGIITEASSNSDVASVIFEGGVSTARSLTETSGRGVGMEAVRSFLKEDGGDVQIVLGDEKSDNPGYYEFKICLIIPFIT